MARNIFLSQSQEDDLRTFLEVPDGAFSRILEERAWDKAMSLLHLIDGVNLPFATSEIVIRLLMGLRLLLLQSDGQITEMVERIGEGILADDWEAKDIDLWQRKTDLLATLLGQPGLRRVAMVVNLSYEYSNILQSSRIITDIRPIFDSEANGIEAAVVTYTLRIKYDSADGEHSLSLALDDNDIVLLADQCERALRKARISEQTMLANRPIMTVIAGNDDPPEFSESGEV